MSKVGADLAARPDSRRAQVATIPAYGDAMRTTVEIDDDLMHKAMKASGETTKRAAVECGLRLLVSTRAQGGIRRLRGKVKWSGGSRDPQLRTPGRV